MFNRALLVGVSALAVFAAATPNPENAKRWGAPPPTTVTATTTATATTTVVVTQTASSGSCGTSSIQCCQSTEAADSAAGSALLELLGIVVQGVDVLLGLQCSPISVVGVGSGSTCDAHPVCCQNNAVGSLISIGCIPIAL